MSILKSKQTVSEASEISNIQNEEDEEPYSPMANALTRKTTNLLRLEVPVIKQYTEPGQVELISNKPSQ